MIYLFPAVAVALNLTSLASSGPLPTDHIDRNRVRPSLLPLVLFFGPLRRISHSSNRNGLSATSRPSPRTSSHRFWPAAPPTPLLLPRRTSDGSSMTPSSR